VPVYDFDDDMVHDVQARIVSACDFMKDYLASESEYLAKEMEQPGQARESKDKKGDAGRAFRPLDANTVRTRFENILGARVSPANFDLLKSTGFDGRIQRDLRSLVVPVLVKGVVLSRELLMRDGKGGILLRIKSKDKLEPLKDFSKIYDLKEAVRFINLRENDPAPDTAYSHAVRRIATDLVNVNITYNRDESTKLREKALASVKPVYFQVAKGESIIRAGEPVNTGHQIKLEGLNSANPPYARQVILVGLALLLALMLKLCFYFSEKYLQRSRYGTEDILLFCLMLVGTIVMVKFVASLSPLTASLSREMDSRSILFAAPVATGAMLASLLVDPRIAFIFAALIAFTSTLAVEGDVYLFAFYFVSGIVGLHGTTRATDRTSILRAGLLVALVNMASVLAVKMAVGRLTSIQ
ncbi:MAG: hypothetical protein FJY85_19435, partial [Deltaproteobacteria bacterium]|nr:hypothetical protein [Deltaproteobacteria bacterium]